MALNDWRDLFPTKEWAETHPETFGPREQRKPAQASFLPDEGDGQQDRRRKQK